MNREEPEVPPSFVRRLNRIIHIMFPHGRKALALFLYLLLLGMLAPFDWSRLLQPFPIISVLSGMMILTASQFVKGQTWPEAVLHARWNAFLAGLISSLLNLLSAFSQQSVIQVDRKQLAGHLAPLLVGGLFSFLLDWLSDKKRSQDSAPPGKRRDQDSDPPNKKRDQDSDPPDKKRAQDSDPPDKKRAQKSSFPASNIEEVESVSPAHSKNVHHPDFIEDVTDLYHVQTIQPILAAHGLTERECHVALKLLEDMPNRDIAATLFIAESTVKKHIQNLYRKCGAEDRRTFRRICRNWLQEASSLPQ